LDGIYDWIARDDAVQAARQIARLTAAVGKFAKVAHPGKACDALKAGLRSVSVGRYIVYFRITDRDMVVLRFIHSARDQEKIDFAEPQRRANRLRNPEG
jgi:toxin ParE1/3/4